MLFRWLAVCLLVAAMAEFGWAAPHSAVSSAGSIDALRPAFTNLQVTPAEAIAHDLVTIAFTASEPLDGEPSVLVNGHAAQLESGGKSQNYTFTYEVPPSAPNGLAEIEIAGVDLVGNMGTLENGSLLEISGNVENVSLSAWPALLLLALIGVAILKRRRVVASILLLLALHSAQAEPVVSFVQQPGGTGTSDVVVTYDLASPGRPCTVSMEVSEDGGNSFTLTPVHVTGDIGDNVAEGTSKTIHWDVTSDELQRVIASAVIRVTADDGVCTGCLPWSDPNTWGGVKPIAGEEVEIPLGAHIVMDEDPPALGGLVVNGHLEFDRRDLNLSADWIMVHGTLEVGSEAVPFVHDAVITLTDTNPNGDAMGMQMGTRGIMVMGGQLELHGLPPAVAWTKISQHAAQGANALQLVQDVAWQPGTQVVVAPTDYYGTSATERFTLTGASGSVLNLSAGLATPRWGRLQYATGTGLALAPNGSVTPPLPNSPLVLDERAEVGNLTRNVVIQAPDDTAWQTQGFGAHIMVMDTGASAHVEGVEIRRGGQRGRLGRYPFHWHRLSYDDTTYLGEATGQYFRDSVVNESQNRGIVIHATNGVAVTNNIIYDVRGHAVFTEDAVERHNTITGNLALRVRNPQAGAVLKQHEVFENGGSSGYWIANPDNTVNNNTAADCQGFGFWLAFPNNPWGASIGVQMRPNRIQFGEFIGNTAHSSGFEGVMIDFVEIDNAGNVAPFQYVSTIDQQDPTWNSGTARRFGITDLATWKNRRGGVWDRVYWPDFTGIVSADNCGRFFAGSGADGVIERSLLVGTSLNNATPRPSTNFPDTLGGNETPTAFATYHSAFDMRNNVLINFPLVAGERSGAFATEDYYIRPVDKGQMRNPGNLMINTHPGYRSMPVLDHYTLVGALWDPNGVWGPANNFFVYDSPFFTYGQTVSPVEPAGQTGGVSVSGPFYGIKEFVLDNSRPYYEPLMAVTATRLDPQTLQPVGTWEVDEALSINWILAPMRHFAAHRDGIYQVAFPSESLPTDVELRFENMLEESDTLVLGVQFSGATTPNAVYTMAPGSGPSVRVYTEVNSLQEVRNSTGQTWWQDTASNLVWVKLQGGSWEFWDPSHTSAVPTSDELLYETTILHINTD